MRTLFAHRGYRARLADPLVGAIGGLGAQRLIVTSVVISFLVRVLSASSLGADQPDKEVHATKTVLEQAEAIAKDWAG
jgi:hypothetical protein